MFAEADCASVGLEQNFDLGLVTVDLIWVFAAAVPCCKCYAKQCCEVLHNAHDLRLKPVTSI